MLGAQESGNLRKGQAMTDWAELNNGIIHIEWQEVFDNANSYDAGDKSFDAQLGKLISEVHRFAFEKGFSAGCASKHPQEVLLSYTGGRA